ncbi:MAG: hypothetical protein H6584_08915 [Flavobacteriales bacterium]|nr:hypothetical protein [Flavobacteriales bacterium]
MKQIFKNLSIVALILTSAISFAQEEEVTIESNDTKKNAVAVNFGLPGYGVSYARKFNEALSLRGRLSFFSFDVDRKNLDLNGRDVDLVGEFKYNTFDLLLDYYPFKTNSSLKLVAGISYLYDAKFDAVVTPSDDVKFGQIVLNNPGSIPAGADWSGVTPYVGLGFGRAIPKNKFGFGFDLGAHITGKPDSYFEPNGIFTPTEKTEFISWMDKFSVIPSFMFHVNYKF